MKAKMTQPSIFERIALAVSKTTGSTVAFIIALCIVLTYLISIPVFNYSDTWQLVFTTGVTLVAFLMAFLMQRSQNKDAMAIELNELVAANKMAGNRLVNVEGITKSELEVLHKYYSKPAELTCKEENMQSFPPNRRGKRTL